jgi:alpha-L-fucosidase 2
MPLGNGDIALNVWVEANGDLVFYIGKSDAWTEDPNDGSGLAKLGRVRVSLSPPGVVPNPSVVQILKLHQGEIDIREGADFAATTFRVWVDANHPVIRVEAVAPQPAQVTVSLEVWRTEQVKKLSPDTIVPDKKDRIVWYHHNGAGSERHVQDWTFGGLIEGKGLKTIDPKTLRSIKAGTSQLISIYPLTTHASPADAWVTKVQQQADTIEALDLEKTRQDHQKWWDQFWDRSWIFLTGQAKAKETTEGYVLQRFITACAGRGAYPIKFNGSLFVVEHASETMGRGKQAVKMPVTADYRAWGGQYWFQNTRAMYWPRLMAGDFDEMLPLFDMYRDMLHANAALVTKYYKHDGAYCAETGPFWGGFQNLNNNKGGNYTANYHTDLLELGMMGLDYYEYTGDTAFLHGTVLPIANAIITFFDQHFPHDSAGKLVLDPDNAIEMYWKVHNPAPDIAGLHAVLARLLALPADLSDDASRANWKRIQDELPDLPTETVDGKKVLLPYEGPQTAQSHNSENPELYAIYPFRLFGLGRPDLEVAIDTFNSRKVKATGCWVQDPIQAAMLGLADLAQKDVTINLTRKDKALKFPAFWERGHDYMPDEDNGGNGENGLQEMLMQINGTQILMLPAWPNDWDANFKLHAPLQTTVEGEVADGKLISLTVTPAARKQDIVLPNGGVLP